MADPAQDDEQEKMRKAVARRLREAQIMNEKKEFVRKYLTTEAFERLMNIKVANYQLFAQLLDLIISLAQNGKIQNKMSDTELTSILKRVSERPEPTIEFRHK